MDSAVIARAQMGLSLAFHIVFASVGIAMPLLMVLAEIKARRTRDPVYLDLAKRWAKGTAVLFAVGAVSGTVLSFELGLLFPGFMKHAGPLVGLPFSLEGFAFFTEAIFLGIYLYGWDRVSPRVHVAAGLIVAASGAASAIFVTFVNAWMNAPLGFVMREGALEAIDPFAALRTPYALHEIPHTLMAAYAATGMAVAGIHAFGLLRGADPQLHRRALLLALWVAVPASLVQPMIGHFAGQQIARYQPAKLAALENLQTTQSYAPLSLGPLHVPGGLSFMAYNDRAATVQGLDAFPPRNRPPAIVRPFFLIMVLTGSALAVHAVWTLWLLWRRGSWHASKLFLRCTLALSPLGFVALEAGWMVTELGRQPWVIYGVLRTHHAATPAGGLALRFAAFASVYLVLAITVVGVLRRHVRTTLPGDAHAT